MSAPDPARGWDIDTEARALLTDVLFAIDRRRGGVEIGKKHLQAAYDAGQAAAAESVRAGDWNQYLSTGDSAAYRLGQAAGVAQERERSLPVIARLDDDLSWLQAACMKAIRTGAITGYAADVLRDAVMTPPSALRTPRATEAG